MPHIAVTMIPGRDDDTKLTFSKRLQAFVSSELGIPPSVVSVSVVDIPKEAWEAEMKKIPPDTIFVAPGQEIDPAAMQDMPDHSNGK